MRNLSIIALILCSGIVYSQQESQFASAFNNPYLYNPAAGGLASVTQIDVVTRMQWVGYGQGPTTLQLSGHSVLKIGSSEPVGAYNSKRKPMHALPTVSVGKLKHVVGGRMMSDAVGIMNKVAVYGSYAIHLPITNDFNLGVGVGLGWGNFRINQSRVVLYDQMDDAYANFLGNSSQQHIFDANAGLVFYGKGLFFGASMSQALNNKVKFNDIATGSFYNRHYFLQLAYGLKIGESVLEPGVVAKFVDNSPANIDFGARFIYRNATWLGVYGRTSNSLVFQFGTTIVENIYISYAYEHSIGKIRNAASGTHELQLGIYLGKRSKKSATSGTDSAASE